MDEIRGRVDHEPAAGGVIDQAERRDEPALRGVAARRDAQRLPAAQVRDASILGNPEDDRLDISLSVIPSEARDRSDL